MLRKSVFASLVNYPSFNPQLRLASAINGISYLAEVNGPYMISTSVSVGEGYKMNDLIIQKGILGSQVKTLCPFKFVFLSLYWVVHITYLESSIRKQRKPFRTRFFCLKFRAYLCTGGRNVPEIQGISMHGG